jgi:hypothetical protein
MKCAIVALSMDVIVHLIDLLCYVDAKALMFAYPTIHTVCSSVMKQKLSDAVQKYLHLYAPSVLGKQLKCDLLKVIKSSNSVLTGSFLLCCMYDENAQWQPNNIDIVSFVEPLLCGNSSTYTDPFLTRWLLELQVLERDRFPDEKEHTTVGYYISTELEAATLKYSRSTLVPNQIPAPTDSFRREKIQLPFLYCEINDEAFLQGSNRWHAIGLPVQRLGCFVPATDFIAKYFDLDFCKVAYDGKDALRVFSWDSLFSRKANLDFDKHFYAQHRRDLLQREEKYPDIDNNPSCNFVKSLKEHDCERLLLRQEKYSARGFCVTFTNQHPSLPVEQLGSVFPKEMYFLKLLAEFQHTGRMPPALYQAHCSINMGVASRFAQFLGIMNFPQNCRFYKQTN